MRGEEYMEVCLRETDGRKDIKSRDRTRQHMALKDKSMSVLKAD